MRFATFNISSGRSPSDGRVDAARFADAVAALDADVLSLQEVDRHQPRSGGVDLTALATRAMGAAHHVFAPTLHGTPGSRWTAAGDGADDHVQDQGDGPAYGCALVSRYPLHDVHVLRIPAVPVAVPLWVPGRGLLVVREEPRVAIVARVEAGARGALTVVGTHLPFVPGWKQWQLRRLVQRLHDRADPLLLLGDLNVRAGTAARITGYRSLVDAPTFPADRPRLQLDHVLLRGDPGRFGVLRGTSTPLLGVSDHRPLVVDVDRG